MKKTERITIRMEPSLLARLDQLAGDGSRSNAVRNVLRYYLMAEEPI